MSKLIASRAIRGAHKLVERAESTLTKALAEKGPDRKVEFPNTGYFLPIWFRLRRPLGDAKSAEIVIERDIYGLLEKAHMGMKKGIKPSLPLWLAPTQVRMVPVSRRQAGMARSGSGMCPQKKRRLSRSVTRGS